MIESFSMENFFYVVRDLVNRSIENNEELKRQTRLLSNRRMTIVVPDLLPLPLSLNTSFGSDGLLDEISIKEIATQIAKQLNYNKPIQFDDTYGDGQFKKTVSNSLLIDTFNDITFTELDVGLKNTIEWYKEFLNSK